MNAIQTLGDVAILARQSTRKSKQAESLPKQRECLERFAEEIDWPYPRDSTRFYEAIVSGMSPFRPELDRLVADIRSGAVRRVMVYDVTRMSRSVLISTGLFKVLRDHGVKLAVQSYHRVLNLDSDDDHTLASIGFLFSETFWMTNARGIRDGMRRLAGHGRWLTSIPFGFRKKGGILEPDPKTAPILARQMELCRHHGFREASRILEREGARVSPSTLQHRFHNPVNRGILRYGATRMGTVPNPNAKIGEIPWRAQIPCPEDAIVVEKAFQSPVAAELWHDEAPEREARRHNRNGLGLRAGAEAFLLSGLAHCSLCGKSIGAHSSSRHRADGTIARYKYAGCRTSGCPNSALPRTRLESRFDAAIRRLLAEPELLHFSIRSALLERVAKADENKAGLEAERVKLGKSLERLEGAYADQMDDDPILASTRDSLRGQINDAAGHLASGQRLRDLAASLDPALGQLRAWMSDFQARRSDAGRRETALFLRRVLAKVEVGEHLCLKMSFRRPLPASSPA